jgi:hypothetical protein
MSLRKADEELEIIERKYHEATKDVELAREACDAEMNKVNIKIICLSNKKYIYLVLRVVSKFKTWNCIELLKWKNIFNFMCLHFKH